MALYALMRQRAGQEGRRRAMPEEGCNYARHASRGSVYFAVSSCVVVFIVGVAMIKTRAFSRSFSMYAVVSWFVFSFRLPAEESLLLRSTRSRDFAWCAAFNVFSFGGNLREVKISNLVRAWTDRSNESAQFSRNSHAIDPAISLFTKRQ